MPTVPSNCAIRFHLTDGALESTPLILCAMEARAHVACGPDDVVLRTTAHTNLPALRQELDLLEELGLGTRRENVILLDSDHPPFVLSGGKLGQNDLAGWQVEPFTNVLHAKNGEPPMACYLREFGFELFGTPPDVARLVNDKGEFLANAHHPDCNIPRGWSLRRDDVADKLEVLSHLAPDALFCLKPAFGASGLGHQFGLRHSRDLAPIYDGYENWVLQEMVPKSFDASVQFVLKGGKIAGDLVVTGQHVDEHGHHLGNYSLNGNVPAWVIEEAKMRVRYLIETFYTHLGDGTGSVDLVVWLGGYGIRHQVYLVELNWRWTAPRYALAAIDRLRPTLGWDEFHWDMRGFRIPRGMHLFEIYARCRPDHPAVRFIPFCFLPEHEFCYGLTVALTPELLATAVTFVRERQVQLLEI